MIRRNWKNIIAWTSICLNIVLIGFLIVQPHPFHPHPPGPPSPELMLRQVSRDLNGSDKEIFERILKKHTAALQNSHNNMPVAFDQIRAAVKQEPFDMETVKQAHQNLYETRGKIDKSIEAFVIELLSHISDDGRKKLQIGPPPKP